MREGEKKAEFSWSPLFHFTAHVNEIAAGLCTKKEGFSVDFGRGSYPVFFFFFFSPASPPWMENKGGQMNSWRKEITDPPPTTSQLFLFSGSPAARCTLNKPYFLKKKIQHLATGRFVCHFCSCGSRISSRRRTRSSSSSLLLPPHHRHHHQGFVELSHFFLMNIQRSNPINISRYGRSRHKSHDFEELSCLRTTESHQSFSPNLGSPSPPETPDSSHCISRIGDYLLLEPLEGDHVFRAAHLHSGEELVCKVSRHSNGTRLLPFFFFFLNAPRIASLPLHT